MVRFPQLRCSRHLHGPSPAIAVAVAVLLIGCSRTGLEIDEGPPPSVDDAATLDDTPDAAPETAPEGPPDAGVDVAKDAAPVADVMPPPTDPCANMPPVPCPGGGFEYCVAGAYSACPKRCGACVPGSQEVCFISYCHSWGIQTCAADGLSFGYCQEESPPSECASIADQNHASPALEQCCIDNGYCCQDQFDLNGNGTKGEPIGRCGQVTCSP
jgi:hypothetical protein